MFVVCRDGIDDQLTEPIDGRDPSAGLFLHPLTER